MKNFRHIYNYIMSWNSYDVRYSVFAAHTENISWRQLSYISLNKKKVKNKNEHNFKIMPMLFIKRSLNIPVSSTKQMETEIVTAHMHLLKLLILTIVYVSRSQIIIFHSCIIFTVASFLSTKCLFMFAFLSVLLNTVVKTSGSASS